MASYLVRRLLVALLSLVGLSFLIFVLAAKARDPAPLLAGGLSPDGSPTPELIELVRKDLGLDRALPIRYGEWLGDAAAGDLGTSLYTGADVAGEIRRTFPATLRLALLAITMVVVFSLPLGIAGAMSHRRWPDQVLRLLSLTAASVPGFLLAYGLIFIFGVRLHLLPTGGMEQPESVVLPALTLALGPTALVSRLLRSSLLEVLGEEYIPTARAKGLPGRAVMVGHALGNASIPVVTVLGLVLGRMLEGAVIVEVIFAWPGVGRLTYDAIIRGDYPIVVGAVLFFGVIAMTLSLLVDLSYTGIDPRVRLGARA